MNQLVSVNEANALISQGRILHIAGDETALRGLKRGQWIGGTIPYFLTDHGGVVERERVFVTELPAAVTSVETRLIDIGHIPAITTDAPRSGFSIVIAPGMSDIHTTYGLTANSIPGIHESPVVGWISGVHLSEIGLITPKVVDGVSGTFADNRIVVMHAHLPRNKTAVIGAINVFEQGDGDEIIFSSPSFSAGPCLINREPDDFYAYAIRRRLNLDLPLITELSGLKINVSFQALDHEHRRVNFYAPVMKGKIYRQAAPLSDYREALRRAVKHFTLKPDFSCNCILNYVHGQLEGREPLPITGPATFGELAHVLVNQTLVYLTVKDK